MKKIIISLFLLLIILVFLPGCRKFEAIDDHIIHSEPAAEETYESEEDKPAEKDLVKALMDEMTVREKVGQLFFVRPDVLDVHFSREEIIDSYIQGSIEITEEMANFYHFYPVGGFVLFGKNIESPEQLKNFTEQLHGLNSIEPMICIDEEGGMIARIANSEGFDVERFPNMQTIAETGNPDEALYLGRTVGGYLSRYGIDADFAPVADVNTNPDNPVIGVRAFGNEPVLAGKMVAGVLNGFHENGILGCIKHFPGHGDTSTDTHIGYAETLKTWDEMMNCEMIPFSAGIEAGTDMVMAAHIAAPNVTGTDEPASFSYVMLTEILRGEMGYEGLIITDALAMDAINEKYYSDEAAERAFNAGADILLMPYDFSLAYNRIYHDVTIGKISMERLDESVYRILSAKYKQSR